VKILTTVHQPKSNKLFGRHLERSSVPYPKDIRLEEKQISIHAKDRKESTMGRKFSTRISRNLLLQDFSSEASVQSGVSSHIHVRGMHSPPPDRHEKCSGEHVRCSEKATELSAPKQHGSACEPTHFRSHLFQNTYSKNRASNQK